VLTRVLGRIFRQDIAAKIRRLKKKRNDVILSHNYQLPEVQDIADYRGDSLGRNDGKKSGLPLFS
jgi:quinolinate synthase